jgi:hypothetical protein
LPKAEVLMRSARNGGMRPTGDAVEKIKGEIAPIGDTDTLAGLEVRAEERFAAAYPRPRSEGAQAER